jgi:peptidoglycan/LPS O-acetylase OafA/YrhL
MPSLDGLRGLAVLAVMAYHANVPFSGGGYIGVDVFFVLSGFLITSLLLAEYVETGDVSFLDFYIRRALRLLPALFLVLAAVITFSAIFGNLRSNAIDVGLVLGYAANWARAFGFDRPDLLGHCWSLSIEEQFYFFWPAVFILSMRSISSKHKLLAIVGSLAALSAFDRVTLQYFGAGYMRLYNGLDTRADSLLIGSALAVALAAYGLPRRDSRLGKAILYAALATVPAFAFLLITNNFESNSLPAMLSVGYTAVALLSAVVILYLAVYPDSRISRLLGYGPIVWTGKISYGLYLIHYPVFRLMHDTRFGRLEDVRGVWRIHGWRGLLLVGFPLVFLLAGLSYRFIETPALRLKRRFYRHRPRTMMQPIPAIQPISEFDGQ